MHASDKVQKIMPKGSANLFSRFYQYLTIIYGFHYLPRSEGVDFRWKDNMIATETIVMYTLSLSHARNAI